MRGQVAAVADDVYDAVLADLDRLEDYTPGGTGNHYERVRVQVRAADGAALDAWTYFAADRIAGELRVSGVRVRDDDWLRRTGP